MTTTWRRIAAALAVTLAGTPLSAQDDAPARAYTYSTGTGSASAFAWSMAPLRGEDKSDAGYGLYKEGYALVLEEKYGEARRKFEELLSKFPKSSYADDARYWTAFSLRNSDRERAIEDYRKFIRDHPKSAYYDDAVADLNALQIETPVADEAPVSAIPPRAPRAPRAPGHPATVTIAPTTENLLRHVQRNMRHLESLGQLRVMSGSFGMWGEEEKIDDATKLKMDALYALGETREDDKSFSTLRDVALDESQVRPLREAAMDALSRFTKHDVLSVFVAVAKKDTNTLIQGAAIDYIGENGNDKNQRVTVLEDLYRTLPKSRPEQRKTIVYTIADVGNERAVEFLKKVALADDDYDLRRDAVYYLGSIGGESARSALYDILKGH